MIKSSIIINIDLFFSFISNYLAINIRFCIDIEKIFDVTPAIVKVPAYQTVLFEITFNPNKRSNLFAREFIGYVFIEQKNLYEETVVFPAITSVRLIGTCVFYQFYIMLRLS